jgi:hypothetical protein
MDIHKLRVELEAPIFKELQEQYGAALTAFWESAEFPAESKNTVLFIEFNIHPNTEFVLKNFMYFTRPHNFSLTIVCSGENEPQIRQILGKHQETTHFIVPCKENGSREAARERYSKLLESPEFWEQVRAEWILTAQTDAYLRKPLPEILWTVEWAAAPWAWKPILVGGSGLTFRKRETVLELSKLKSSKFVHEDVFYSQRVFSMKKKILPLEEAKHIFSESFFVDDPVGVHQWWTYLYQSDDHKYITKYSKIYKTLHIPK